MKKLLATALIAGSMATMVAAENPDPKDAIIEQQAAVIEALQNKIQLIAGDYTDMYIENKSYRKALGFIQWAATNDEKKGGIFFSPWAKNHVGQIVGDYGYDFD